MNKEWINARTMHRIRKDSPKQIEQDHQRAHECSSFKGTGGIYVDDGAVQELVQLAAVRRMMVLHS
jgi:hypothetical protein